MTTALPLVVDPRTRIATITLEANQGPMTILDRALIERLELALQVVPADAQGLILASGSPRVFVAGADLKQIAGLSTRELDQYLAFGQRVFGMLCALPMPTVAAINGAALGGGLELAMHCDGLVALDLASGVKPYPVGLPEAGLQICPGWGGTNLLPARMDAENAMRRTCAGEAMLVDKAGAAGVIDRFAPAPESLLPVCAAWLAEHPRLHEQRTDRQPLRWIGRPSVRERATAALHKLQPEIGGKDPAAACLLAVQAGLAPAPAGGWQAALEVERRELNRLRHEPAGQAAIQAFFDRSAKK